MDSHISYMCKTAWFHLFRIGKIRQYLTTDQAKSVVHACVTSRLDMNNSLLIGASQVQLAKLQRIQNAAARLIIGAKKDDHVTPILKSLHWLPVHLRIRYKLLMITYKVLHGDGPAYLKDLLVSYQPKRSLRSSRDTSRLEIPVTRLKTYGDRSFSRAAPAHWNNLPFEMRSCKTLAAFKTSLKTRLYRSYYL